MGDPSLITPDPDKAAEALQDWIFGEIKDSTTQSFELAKFLFGVSSGSIGILVSVSELSENSWSGQEWAALVFFVLASGIALLMALPQIYPLDKIENLAATHSAFVTEIKNRSIVWGLCWVVALFFAAAGFADRAG